MVLPYATAIGPMLSAGARGEPWRAQLGALSRRARLSRSGRTYLVAGLLFVTLYSIVFAADVRGAGYAYLLPPALAAVTAALKAGSSNGSERAGWILMSLVVIAWIGGDTIYVWYEERGAEAPFPGYGDLLYLVGYPLLAASLILLVGKELRLRTVRKYALDWLAILLVAGVIIWRFTLPDRPDYDSSLAFGVALSYPIGDLLIVGAILAAYYQGPIAGFKLWLLLAGILLVTADVIYYMAGTRGLLVDNIYLLSYVAMGVAPFASAGTAPLPGGITRDVARGVLPIVVAFAVVYMTLVSGFDGWGLVAAIFVGLFAGAVTGHSYLALVALAHSRDREEAYLKAILVAQSQMGEAVVVLDGSSVVFANEAAEQLTGRTAEELSVPAAFDALFVEMPEPLFVPGEARDSAHAPPREAELRGDNGEGKPLELATVRMELPDPGADLSLILMRDVTWRRQAQRELQRAQSYETLGALAGGVAHDFNNLLTAIGTGIAVIEASSSLSEDDRETIALVHDALAKAGELSRSMLTVAKAGLRTFEPVDLVAIAAEGIALSRNAMGPQVDVQMVSSQDVFVVHGDSGQLGQCLLNFLFNAREAMGERGGVIAVRVVRGGERITLSVRDTGLGMTKETLDRVFEPFFTTKPGGTGLGLASCWQIAQNHGGSVSVESEPGRGTMFSLHLPAAD